MILTLEGKVTGPWVGELERAWNSIGAREAVSVDLRQVSFVDASGKGLLEQMWHAGADFVTDSPLMKQVIEEVTGRPNVAGQQAKQSTENISTKEKANEKAVSGNNAASEGIRAHEVAPRQRSG